MKGIKNSISKESFNRSTLRGIIRKGFITKADFDKTKLTEHTKQVASGLSADLFFVRDKNLCFGLDTKNKVIYKVADCALAQYADYVIKQNKDWSVENIDNVHPADLRSRGLAVEKVAESAGFTL